VAKPKSSLSSRMPRRGELDWNKILVRAAEIVKSYDTGVTLRQLYYRLVSEGWIPNKQQSYKTLSAKSAQARREGWFPALIDRTREIEQYQTFPGPRNALNWLEQTLPTRSYRGSGLLPLHRRREARSDNTVDGLVR
jgi:hypothetical protein